MPIVLHPTEKILFSPLSHHCNIVRDTRIYNVFVLLRKQFHFPFCQTIGIWNLVRCRTHMEDESSQSEEERRGTMFIIATCTSYLHRVITLLYVYIMKRRSVLFVRINCNLVAVTALSLSMLLVAVLRAYKIHQYYHLSYGLCIMNSLPVPVYFIACSMSFEFVTRT